MKRNLNIACLLFLVFASLFANAQEYGNGNITTQIRNVGSFNRIDVGCAIKLYLTQGNENTVKVETDENLQPYITTQANAGVLVLSCKNVRSVTKMNIYVTFKELKGIETSGAASVKANTPIVNKSSFLLSTSGASRVEMQIETDNLTIDASGASNLDIITHVQKLVIDANGASRVKLEGSANIHSIDISGASFVDAGNFVSNSVTADVSGASNAKINAKESINAELSGMSKLSYLDKSTLKTLKKSGNYQIRFGTDRTVVTKNDSDDESYDYNYNYNYDEPIMKKRERDTISIKVNNKPVIEVIDIDDAGNTTHKKNKTSVKVGKSTWVDFQDHSSKYKGHWFGFDLGVNGFLNDKNAIDYPENYPYLDLNYNKSIYVGLNILQYSIPLYKDKFGITTGLGLSWNNFRFAKNVILSSQNGVLSGGYDNDLQKKYEKSKLVVSYLEVPLLLGFQTNPVVSDYRVHGEFGVIGGIRLGSHTKVVYNDGSRKKDKNHDDFFISPLKADATVRLGIGHVSIFGKYSLTEMFRNNKGPVIHPFSVGLSIN